MRHGSPLRDGLGAATAGLAAAAVLWPLAVELAGPGAGRPVTVTLLLETAYLLVACTVVGVTVPRGRGIARAALLAVLPAAVAVAVAAASTGAFAALSIAQLPALATGLLGGGIGRAARDLAGRTASASALAMLGAAAFGFGLLAVSHLSPGLASSPRLGAVLLSLDPFVAVTSAAGVDLVRTRELYEALTLPGHRFSYPSPILSSLVLTLAGLALGWLRPLARRPSRGLRASGTRRPALSSSREISA